MAEGEGGSQHP